MARKLLNRKQLREEIESAEGTKGKKTEKKEETTKPKRKATPRKSHAKAAKEVRLKAFWGVFSQSLSPVVLFEYSQRKQADQKAEQLTNSRKSPHFVQLIKKVIEE